MLTNPSALDPTVRREFQRLASQPGLARLCTSTTRPTDPADGWIIFETDTKVLRVRSNGAWVAVVAVWA